MIILSLDVAPPLLNYFIVDFSRKSILDKVFAYLGKPWAVKYTGGSKTLKM